MDKTTQFSFIVLLATVTVGFYAHGAGTTNETSLASIKSRPMESWTSKDWDLILYNAHKVLNDHALAMSLRHVPSATASPAIITNTSAITPPTQTSSGKATHVTVPQPAVTAAATGALTAPEADKKMVIATASIAEEAATNKMGSPKLPASTPTPLTQTTTAVPAPSTKTIGPAPAPDSPRATQAKVVQRELRTLMQLNAQAKTPVDRDTAIRTANHLSQTAIELARTAKQLLGVGG